LDTKYITKQQLYKEVEACRLRLHSDGITEISIRNICDEYPHICVDYTPLTTPGLRGLVVFATLEKPFHRIIINSLLPEAEQQFHSIHEYMHIYLHSNLGGADITCFDKKIGTYRDSGLEWQANEGAAELIMPYKEFIPLFLSMFKDYSAFPDDWKYVYGDANLFQALADHYHVSVPVIQNRISSLSYEIDQFRSGIAADDIKLIAFNKQKSLGIAATDYVKEIQKTAAAKYYFNQALDWNAVIR